MKSLDIFKEYLDKEGYLTSFENILDDSRSLLVTSADRTSTALITPFIGGGRIGREIASSKPLTYKLADRLSIHKPSTLIVSSAKDAHGEAARMFMQGILDQDKTVIVKPSDSHQSKGLTLNISSEDEVAQAVDEALQFSNTALIQEQIQGEEIRITCVDGKAISVLLRERPKVYGDGVSTVDELIDAENIQRQRITSLVPYPKITKVNSYLSADAQYIPAKNEVVVLSSASMVRNGASIYEIIDHTHGSFISLAESVAAFLPSGVISVDCIVKDPSRPALEDNYALIEVNTGSSLLLYYACRDGKNCNIIEDHLGPRAKKHLANRNILPALPKKDL